MGTGVVCERGPSRAASRTLTVVRIGVLSAVAFLLMYLETNLPLFPAFLQYDAGEVPALIGGFAMGPLAGAAVVVGKCFLFLVSGKDEAGWLGTAANLLLGMAMVLAAAFVYLRQRTRRGALLGLAAGVAAGTAVMAAANYWFFLPTYGIPREALGSTLKVVVLFNLVKGTLSSTLTFLLYKRVRPLLSSG